MLVFFALAGAAKATPGDFDLSFAGSGLVPQQFGDNTGDGDIGNGIAAQADGKIVVSGTAASSDSGVGVIARYLVGGALDPSFGNRGMVFDSVFDPRALVVQPDGKIVAAGTAPAGAFTAYGFARYLSNGSPDPSFGGGTGKVSVLVNTADNQQRAQAVAIAPDGKIVAAGETNDGAGVVRLNANGTPDSTFNSTGSRNLGTGPNNDAEGVAVQPDGKVLIAVASGAGGGDGFNIIRLDDQGMPDSFFGTAGVAHFPVPVGGEGRSTSVAVQPDGKIVVGGYGETPGNASEFAVARLDSAGNPDMSFSGDGQELTPMPSVGPEANGRAIFIQPNGKIVLAGTTEVQMGTARTTLAFARYNPADGSLDSSFGDAGIRVEPLPAGWDEDTLASATLACDGKIIGVGDAALAPTAHASFLTARVLGDPVVCPGLNPPPLVPPPDRTKPRSHIKRIPHVIRASKLKRFSGTASDNNGVAKVEIALLRRVGKTAAFSRGRASCLWLRSNRAKFKTLKPRRGKCASARFLRAKGTTRWVFKLRKRLPPGSYVLYARATDKSGNKETSFGRKRGNELSFKVRRG